ncbi:FAD-dependent monooxygenase [Crossiella sp. CA-258035]|uniref:FAD-dependent monooxygenase n=1 Tax=Crossiella sp. CA-258035 TaxID=2981138 RepID=UPI0024BC608D|nr:FAD-dependent monooxygenase [Crossiella sp. CA-258035]WHT20866.1 FAD-dependent monooxygenase [Crossiella sp. CA-258035]
MSSNEERTPVLITGGGLAGLTASLFLSSQGIDSILVDKHPGPSLQGRARGINVRTTEIYRAFGIADAVYEAGRPFERDEGGVHCQSIAGEWHWLFRGGTAVSYDELSAGRLCLADQSSVEPVLIEAARARGADQRFSTELLSFTETADGVHAVTKDRTTGVERRIHADYLIGADGNRSTVRGQLGIHRDGPGVAGDYLAVLFDADLSELIPERAILWFVVNPEAPPAFLTTTANPNRWAAAFSYDAATQDPAGFTPERLTAMVHTLLGRADIPLDIVDVTPWQQFIGVAERFRQGRVFLAGDSAHVWPPAGAYGANTGVQDSHNLAWKLAAVLKGWASPALLDSYEPERRPLAQAFMDITVARQAHRTSSNPEQEVKDDLRWMFGQRYTSPAILGRPFDTPFADDHLPPATPGHRAPHLWLDRDGARIALHDLPSTGFTLLTGPDGEAWPQAAKEVAAELNVPITAHRIGTDLLDPENQWPTRYALPEGAVLLRPDGYIAWRTETGANPHQQLHDALRRLLHP